MTKDPRVLFNNITRKQKCSKAIIPAATGTSDFYFDEKEGTGLHRGLTLDVTTASVCDGGLEEGGEIKRCIQDDFIIDGHA